MYDVSFMEVSESGNHLNSPEKNLVLFKMEPIVVLDLIFDKALQISILLERKNKEEIVIHLFYEIDS
jgi:hypothetical protein